MTRRAALLWAGLLALTAAVALWSRHAPPEAPAPRAMAAPALAGAAGFRRAAPGYPWSFPRDTGSHPDYATEWWYYTGHLSGPRGEWYGYELTFFRAGVLPPGTARRSAWALSHLYLAHFAVTDPQRRRFDYDERVARGALGMAGAATDRQNVWLGRWSARLVDGTHHLEAHQDGWRLDLRATPTKPPVLQGRGGYSQKGSGAGHASQYYSYTRLRTVGTLWRQGQAIAVAGESWMDHEFSTDSLAPDEVGWDWFSLQLDTGEELMLYRLRRRDGSADPHSGGTWVARDGATTALGLDDYALEELDRWRSPKTRITYPSRWRVRVPSRGLTLEVTPILADQELVTSRSTGVTYWEGAVDARGTLRGRPVRGQGYVELTGYSGSVPGR